MCIRDSYDIEPDVSAACYFYAMSPLLHVKSKVMGVHQNSLQGDVAFLDVLAEMCIRDRGMRVLDLCAAPGGKSTQLATYLGDSGLLVSNEINKQRSRILSQNIERMGIKNAIVTNEDSFVLACLLYTSRCV